MFEELKEMIVEELKEIEDKGKLTATDVDPLYKLSCSFANLGDSYVGDNYSMNSGMMRRYSRDGGWTAEGYYDRGGRDNYSGRMGTHYVRGHYSRNDRAYDMDSSRDAMADEMEEMMRTGNMTANEKQIMQKAMELMRR